MAAVSLSPPDRIRLLGDLQTLPRDADAASTDPTKFLPLAVHGRALDPEIVLIRGERGAGKTALFHVLQQCKKQPEIQGKFFPNLRIQQAVWVDGFSDAASHPQVANLDRTADTSPDELLRVMWTAHAACRLAEEGVVERPPPGRLWSRWQVQRNQPDVWAKAAMEELGELTQWLDDCDRMLLKESRTVFLTYDSLDKLGVYDLNKRNRFVSTLLALWLSFANRYRAIRAKIFIREDLFEAGRRAFVDASKLASRSVSLEWQVEGLYRLLIRMMASSSEPMREWLSATGMRVELVDTGIAGWMPPEPLPETGRPSQKRFIDHLAGERMGSGIKKGYTYRWIPNRLQDAHTRIVPRSLLNLAASAARHAVGNPKAKYHRLLHPQELVAALGDVSRDRVAELQEEHPVVLRLESLGDAEVMMDRRKVEALLSGFAPSPHSQATDPFGSDGEAVAEELIRLGVLSVRPDGRIDVPDLYRYGFGIKRKGGVARPR